MRVAALSLLSSSGCQASLCNAKFVVRGTSRHAFMRRVAQIPANVGTDGMGYGGLAHPVFWIHRFHPHSVKQHTAFAAKSRTEVDPFYAAALKACRTDNGGLGTAQAIRIWLLCRIRARSRRQQY